MRRILTLTLLSFYWLAYSESNAQKPKDSKLPEKFAYEYAFDYATISTKQYPQSEEYYLVDRSLMNGVKDYKKLTEMPKFRCTSFSPWYLDAQEKSYIPYWVIKDSIIYLTNISDTEALSSEVDSISRITMNKVAKITGIKILKEKGIPITSPVSAKFRQNKDGWLPAKWITGNFRVAKITMWDEKWLESVGVGSESNILITPSRITLFDITVKNGRIITCAKYY